MDQYQWAAVGFAVLSLKAVLSASNRELVHSWADGNSVSVFRYAVAFIAVSGLLLATWTYREPKLEATLELLPLIAIIAVLDRRAAEASRKFVKKSPEAAVGPVSSGIDSVAYVPVAVALLWERVTFLSTLGVMVAAAGWMLAAGSTGASAFRKGADPDLVKLTVLRVSNMLAIAWFASMWGDVVILAATVFFAVLCRTAYAWFKDGSFLSKAPGLQFVDATAFALVSIGAFSLFANPGHSFKASAFLVAWTACVPLAYSAFFRDRFTAGRILATALWVAGASMVAFW